MTNPTPHGQVPAIQRYKIGYHSDEWGVRSLSPTGIYDDAGPWVRYEDHAAQIAALRTQQPAPATQQPEGDVVAYLDVGAGGYLDLGSELSEDALQQLPKGRHALVIAGTYGIDGYVAAPQPSPTTKPAPQQEAQEPVMIYHGDCTIDCGEHGHHNVELLRMIPAGSKLYTAPQPSPAAQGDALSDDAVRVPLDSLHADAAYLIGRLREGSMPYARVIEIIRERIDAAKAAIRARAAQGDALDAARYRFLRDGEWRDTDLEPFIRLQLNTLWDAKIDAARAAQEGK